MSTSGKGFWDIFRVPGCSSDRLWLQYMGHIERKQEFTAEVVRSHSSGKKLHHITFRWGLCMRAWGVMTVVPC